ncbi:retinol dehydrogenase 12-like [Mytilus trossulus]|uniref:retinol dehydrogenase 12-like n=1 Tax=Mytilus trossulus TaxID=6551 RepID=UPI0030063D3C
MKKGGSVNGTTWRQIGSNVKDVFRSPTFLVPVIISIILLALFFLRRYLRWTVKCSSKNGMEGKTVVITGGNTGLGKATAYELAKRNARVIIACRNDIKGEAVARSIKIKTGNPFVYCSHLDLGNQRSIREFVQDFLSKESALHVLINNAAYMGPRATTDDGYERTFGVNYLGHFYLTYLLQDRLKKCAPSRIINIASDAIKKGKLDFDDLPLRNYDIYGAYARSKASLGMFTIEAHRRWLDDTVASYAVHPGAVCTDLLRSWPGIFGQILRVASRILFKSPDDGCQTIVYCAVSNGLKKFSGKLFSQCDVSSFPESLRDKEQCRKLWDLSLELCGLEKEQDLVDKEPELNTNHVTNATPHTKSQ